tara:strand:+ start:960 stop:1241 length:282 start_codon:yes stop_codon:yes gene_type:complete
MHCHAKIRIGFIRDSETPSFYTLAINNVVELKDKDIALPCSFDLPRNQPYSSEPVPECIVHDVTDEPGGDGIHYFEPVRITQIPTDNHLNIVN